MHLTKVNPVPAPPPTPPSPQRQRSAVRLLLILLLLALPPLLTGLAIYGRGPLTADKNIVIPQGASVRDIAALLRQQGAVNNPLVFRLAARLIARDKLHAGEFAFAAGQSIADQIAMLRDESRVIVRRFTVPEGLTSWEIVGLLRDEPALSGEIADIPADGELLPETYHFGYGDNRQGLIDRMRKGQRALLGQLWEKRAADLPIQTPEQAMVMASLVEKETGKKAEERPRVAGVFYNRLRLNMRLQSDPTAIYALTQGQGPLSRELTREDLTRPSPFNTYASDGLPPSPICNPGRAAIEAALHPEANDFLYFVADGTGGHAFAKDLATHNRNVARWLKLARP